MKKIPYSNAGKILTFFELSDQAKEMVDPAEPPQNVIALLEKEKLNIDLASFYAHALPMRESIWWGALALQQRMQDWNSNEQKVVEEVMAWVREPNEPMRRRIETQIKKLPNDSAPKWLGQAVFWSGQGSIAPIDNPVVMPAELLYAKGVAGAINTAAVIPEWKGYKGYYKQVFAMALDLANGGSGTGITQAQESA